MMTSCCQAVRAISLLTTCRCLLSRHPHHSSSQRAVSGTTASSSSSSKIPASTASDTTHFGFQQVTRGEKAAKVHQVFSHVAGKYDLMNDVMSIGIHRCWKNMFIDKLDPIPGYKYLDVAGGTGDIGFRILNHVASKEERSTGGEEDVESISRRTHVTICDMNQNMLSEGEKRFKNQVKHPDSSAVSFVIGDAMDLAFEDESFDAYTIAFGIRNVVDIQQALGEAHRVLKPGGMFHCLEFSHVQNPILQTIYDWYSFNLIPVYGEILAGDWKSYQYLVESIRKFPDQEDFKDMIIQAGFKLVHYENLTNGVACIHSGFKAE